MNELKLYKNPKPYPFYSATLTLYKTLSVTPRNQDLKTGYIDLQLTNDESLLFNYLSFQAGDRIIYAWVTNIEERGGNFNKRVSYNVDALRTYKNNLVLGTQFVLRSPTATSLKDPFLGSTQAYNDISVRTVSIGNTAKRYAVVQVRGDGSEIMSNTPGQPTPYQFYFCEYSVNNWNSTSAIYQLLNKLTDKSKTTNIVTIYSIPYVDMASLYTADLPVKVLGSATQFISGWKLLHSTTSPYRIFRTVTPINFHSWFTDPLTLSDHNISIIIPEAGILNVPDEIAFYTNPALVREIDVFSGACNYMLTLDNGMFPTHVSCRGGSFATIPILSDPYDTYVSQNQNSMTVGLLGDVANLTAGVITKNPALLGMGSMSMVNKMVNQLDAQNVIPSNPPSYLGSSLVSEYNNQVFVVTVRKPYDNASAVHSRYGYPCNKLQTLTLPSAGFIQTDSCSVSSDGSVPLWAIQEVNNLLNTGILFS